MKLNEILQLFANAMNIIIFSFSSIKSVSAHI